MMKLPYRQQTDESLSLGLLSLPASALQLKTQPVEKRDALQVPLHFQLLQGYVATGEMTFYFHERLP
jgi:hypothetical protein